MAIQDWEQVGERSEWINSKTGEQIVQITPLNGRHEGELGVSVRTPEDTKGMRSIKLEKYFGKFNYGYKWKDQPSQIKADKFVRKYMEKN
jgi:hypothetical protein